MAFFLAFRFALLLHIPLAVPLLIMKYSNDQISKSKNKQEQKGIDDTHMEWCLIMLGSVAVVTNNPFEYLSWLKLGKVLTLRAYGVTKGAN